MKFSTVASIFVLTSATQGCLLGGLLGGLGGSSSSCTSGYSWSDFCSSFGVSVRPQPVSSCGTAQCQVSCSSSSC